MSRDALIVGINKYQYLNPLKAPADDAEAIAKMLEQYGEFDIVNRLPVGKNDVTVPNLKQALGELFNPSGKSIPDLALFFFAGHGLRTEIGGIREGFLATSEASSKSGNMGLSFEWLQRLLMESPVKTQIIWLDCCHSGEVIDFNKADPPDRGRARSRLFIAACREYQLAYEDKHGILTNALLNALDPTAHPTGIVDNLTLVKMISDSWQNKLQTLQTNNSGERFFLTRCAKPAQIIAPVSETACPYRGLRYFDCNDEDPKFFFGRTALTDQLLDKVRESNFMAVLGASGSGKSSVIRAGLIHQLKLGQRLSGSDTWKILMFRPGEEPLENLALAFMDENVSAIDRACQLDKAKELLCKGASGLDCLISAMANDNRRVVLLADQFEEVFTLSRDSAKRRQFFECLLQALPKCGMKICLILAMRADFFGKCAEQHYAGLYEFIQKNLITVTPMNDEELRDAIVKPAKLAGAEVEEELVREIIEDVKKSPGTLPLMQYALTELWKVRDDNFLKLTQYSRMGGVKGTLAKRADEIYGRFSEPEKDIVRRIFIKLTQLGEGTEDTRRQVRKDALISLPEKEEMVNEVIRKLADENLIVTGEAQATGDARQAAVVDVAHEALIRNWTQLRSWLDNSRDDIRFHRRLEEGVKHWQNNKRHQNLLWRSPDLDLLEKFYQKNAYEMSSLEIEFFNESIQAKQQNIEKEEAIRIKELEQAQALAEEQQKRAELAEELSEEQRKQTEQAQFLAEEKSKTAKTFRNGLVVTVILFIAAFAFGFWATTAEKQAKENLVKAKHSLGTFFIEKGERTLEQLKDSNSARLYSLHALSLLDPTFKDDARAWAIGSIIQQSEYPLVFSVKLVGIPNKMVKRPDGSFTMTPEYMFDHLNSDNHFSIHINYSNDGKVLTWIPGDNAIWLFDIPSGTRTGRLSLPEMDKALECACFSPDNKILAMGASDNTIRFWDIERKKEIRRLTGHTQRVRSVCFSSDGKILASGAADGSIKLWDVNTGQETVTLMKSEVMKDEIVINAGILGMKFTPDGKFLVSKKAFGGDIQVSNLQNSETTIIPISGINSFDVSPDGKTIAFTIDKKVVFWDIAAHKYIRNIEGGGVISFSPNGKYISSIAYNKPGYNISIIDIQTGKEKVVLPLFDIPRRIAFSPDGKTLISEAENTHTEPNYKSLYFWDITDLNDSDILIQDTTEIDNFSLSPDGKKIAMGVADGSIRLWDVKSGKKIMDFEGSKKNISIVAFSPDGKILASGTTSRSHSRANLVVFSEEKNKDSIRLWEVETGKEIMKLGKGAVHYISFSPDGGYIASVVRDYENVNRENKKMIIRLWDIHTGKEIQSFQWNSGQKDFIDINICFSPDGKILAFAVDVLNEPIRLWNIKDGSELSRFKVPEGSVGNSLYFLPDGERLAFMGRLKAMIRNINTGEEKVITLAGGHFNFTHDGKILAIASGNQVMIGEIENTKLIATLRVALSEKVGQTSFFPDGKSLANISGNDIRFWDLSYIYDNSSIENQIKEAEKRYYIKIDSNGFIKSTSPQEDPKQKPVWSKRHPFYWLERAEQGDAEAMVQLGLIYDRENENEKALYWYQKSADTGNAYGKERLTFLKKWIEKNSKRNN